jgi:NAD(P) transhydrogenase subunit alpha
MYSKNVSNFLSLLVKDGKLTIDMEDEILRETLVTHKGEIMNARIRDAGSPML